MALGGVAVNAAMGIARAFGTAARAAGKAGQSAGRSGQNMEGASNAARGLQTAFAGLSSAIGLVVTAFVALVGVIKSAAEHLQSIGEAARQSGGTPKEMAALMGAGFNVKEIASRAAALAQQLHTDPTAAMYGQQMGIRDYGGVHGAVDQAANLLKLFQKLREMGPGMEQTRMARMYGMQDMLGQMNVSDPVKKAQDAYAELGATIADADALRAANDLTEAWRLVMLNWKMMISAFGKNTFEPITAGLLKLGETIGEVAKTFNGAELGMQVRALAFQFQFLMGFISTFVQWLGSLAQGLGRFLVNTGLTPSGFQAQMNQQMQAQAAAMKQNTQATQQNTRANEEMRRVFQQGMFGGGPRAQAALGKGWQGLFLAELQMSGAWKQGVFGL